MIIEARNIQKSFTDGKESIPVLRGIDFGVERGEIVSLEGPSGSSKTTFLSILGCILTPSNGNVVIDGTVDGCAVIAAEYATVPDVDCTTYARTRIVEPNGITPLVC